MAVGRVNASGEAEFGAGFNVWHRKGSGLSFFSVTFVIAGFIEVALFFRESVETLGRLNQWIPSAKPVGEAGVVITKIVDNDVFELFAEESGGIFVGDVWIEGEGDGLDFGVGGGDSGIFDLGTGNIVVSAGADSPAVVDVNLFAGINERIVTGGRINAGEEVIRNGDGGIGGLVVVSLGAVIFIPSFAGVTNLISLAFVCAALFR